MEATTTATGPETQGDPAEGGSEDAAGSEAVAEAATPVAGETDERDESGRYLSSEARKYRIKLRETETERDQLRDRLEGYERAEVERIAGDSGLAAPSDVWQFGAELEHLRGEDGSIDAETVSGLVAAIVKERPGLAAKPVGDLGIGRGAAAAGTRPEEKVGLSQLLKPGRG